MTSARELEDYGQFSAVVSPIDLAILATVIVHIVYCTDWSHSILLPVLDVASAFFSVSLALRIKISWQLLAWLSCWEWPLENHVMVLNRREIWTGNWGARLSVMWKIQWRWGGLKQRSCRSTLSKTLMNMAQLCKCIWVPIVNATSLRINPDHLIFAFLRE